MNPVSVVTSTIVLCTEEDVYNFVLVNPERKKEFCHLITESKYAYYWAENIGDKEIMRDRVTESKYAYYWAENIGDKEIMRDRVTESEWAFNWARCLGDFEIMRDRVTDSELIVKWNSLFCNNPELQITTK